MRYQVLATDYDGTLACDGHVSESTLAALQRFVASGRRFILVTGRELPQWKSVFSGLCLFHWVVANPNLNPHSNKDPQWIPVFFNEK